MDKDLWHGDHGFAEIFPRKNHEYIILVIGALSIFDVN